MKSMLILHSRTKFFLLLIITFYIIFGYIKLLCYAKGQVGIIKLQHAYTDIIASSKKSHIKGITEEHIELFKAHDKARHGRVLTHAVEFSLGGNYSPYLAGLVHYWYSQRHLSLSLIYKLCMYHPSITCASTSFWWNSEVMYDKCIYL